MGVLGQKYGSFGSKVWEFWAVSAIVKGCNLGTLAALRQDYYSTSQLDNESCDSRWDSPELRNYGIMELRIGRVGSKLMAHCSQPNHTLYSLYLLYPLDFCPLPFVVRLRSTSEASAVVGGLRRNYGFMESRIDGIMELRKGQVGSWLIAHCS